MSLFADDIILYVENPEDTPKSCQNEYMNSVQWSGTSTSKEPPDKEIKEISFTLASKIIKYLGTNIFIRNRKKTPKLHMDPGRTRIATTLRKENAVGGTAHEISQTTSHGCWGGPVNRGSVAGKQLAATAVCSAAAAPLPA